MNSDEDPKRGAGGDGLGTHSHHQMEAAAIENAAAGAGGRTWRAYLSTEADGTRGISA